MQVVSSDPEAVFRDFMAAVSVVDWLFGGRMCVQIERCAILEDPHPVMREAAERRVVEAGGQGQGCRVQEWRPVPVCPVPPSCHEPHAAGFE